MPVRPEPDADPFAGARMIPLLPCGSVDEVRDFWVALGCDVTWFQRRPNPYVALRRGALEIHYYELPGHVPDHSHSTCSVLVDDTGAVFAELAAGLRSRYGRLPLTGCPRITRPRARANNDGLSGFSLIDPGGNWVRFSRGSGSGRRNESRTGDAPIAESSRDIRSRMSPLARSLSDAVVQADSHGDAGQARKILAGAVRRAGELAEPHDLVRALGYLAELHVRVDDLSSAREVVDRLDAVVATLDEPARVRLRETLDEVSELRAAL